MQIVLMKTDANKREICFDGKFPKDNELIDPDLILCVIPIIVLTRFASLKLVWVGGGDTTSYRWEILQGEATKDDNSCSLKYEKPRLCAKAQLQLEMK